MAAVVRIAGSDDADGVGLVLADGFSQDPVMGWVFGEPGRRAKLEDFFGFLAREAIVPMGATYLLPGSAAAWTPPGAPDWPAERGERFVEVLSRSCTDADLERLGELDRASKEHHPDERCWHLSTVATAADARGQGLGSRLLETSLARVDADHLPAYLESTNPRNVSLYLRHGFEVTGTIEFEGGPPMTAMWRHARPL